MGKRGVMMHVLGGEVLDELGAIGQPVAILDRNDRWTSFFPMDGERFSALEASAALRRVVAQVWFSSDSGVVLQVFDAGTDVGEISLPGAGKASAADVDFIRALERLGVLDAYDAATLKARMADPPAILHEWTMDHGLEFLLDVPVVTPLPDALPAAMVQNWLPDDAEIIQPDPEAARPTKPFQEPAATESGKAWTPQERETVELHFEYWRRVWSLNNWRLYNLYKKRLPAARRREVDQLCDALDRGDDATVLGLVQSILASTWEAEDWDACIRDPGLEDNDPDVWAAWMAKVAKR